MGNLTDWLINFIHDNYGAILAWLMVAMLVLLAISVVGLIAVLFGF